MRVDLRDSEVSGKSPPDCTLDLGMITTASLLLLFASCTSAFVLPASAPARHVAGRCAAVRALDPSGRWSDPILDESLPDPVYDDGYKYKGNTKIGFNDFAETLNGRAAMVGFFILFMQELIFGKGVLSQYGLPCEQPRSCRARSIAAPPQLRELTCRPHLGPTADLPRLVAQMTPGPACEAAARGSIRHARAREACAEPRLRWRCGIACAAQVAGVHTRVSATPPAAASRARQFHCAVGGCGLPRRPGNPGRPAKPERDDPRKRRRSRLDGGELRRLSRQPRRDGSRDASMRQAAWHGMLSMCRRQDLPDPRPANRPSGPLRPRVTF